MKKQQGKKGKPASPDSLTKGGKKQGIELTEEQLKNVSGGLKLELKYG
jgi:bacteriocin-like protein